MQDDRGPDAIEPERSPTTLSVKVPLDAPTVWSGEGVDHFEDAMQATLNGEPYWLWRGTIQGPDAAVGGVHLIPRSAPDDDSLPMCECEVTWQVTETLTLRAEYCVEEDADAG